MKKTYNHFKRELNYILFSKVVHTMFALLVLIVGLWTFNTLNALGEHYKEFTQTKKYYLRTGENVEEKLKEEAKVTTLTEADGAIVTNVENPLRYEFDRVKEGLNLLKPHSYTEILFEFFTFVMSPILFTVFGALLSTYDFKNRTIKVKSIQDKWTKVVLSKQLLNYTVVIVTVIVFVILARILSEGIYLYAKSMIPDVEQFISKKDIVVTNNFLQKFGMGILIGSMYSTLGFMIGLIFKNIIVPVIAIFLYLTFIPSLGIYDLKNLINSLGSNVFDFNSPDMLLVTNGDVSNIVALLLITTSLIALFFINQYIAKQQNKYII